MSRLNLLAFARISIKHIARNIWQNATEDRENRCRCSTEVCAFASAASQLRDTWNLVYFTDGMFRDGDCFNEVFSWLVPYGCIYIYSRSRLGHAIYRITGGYTSHTLGSFTDVLSLLDSGRTPRPRPFRQFSSYLLTNKYNLATQDARRESACLTRKPQQHTLLQACVAAF